MKRLLTLLACWLVAAPGFAQTVPAVYRPADPGHFEKVWYHGFNPCGAYGTTFVDGCAQSNSNSEFTFYGQYGVSFGANARQSGQTWATGDHPQPFAVAGDDYPLGPDKTATYTNLDTGSLPSGCTKISTGGPNNGPRISCNQAGVNYDIEHYNIVYELQIGANVTGSVIVANNHCINSATLNFASASCFDFLGFNNSSATPISSPVITALGLSNITTLFAWNGTNGEAQTGSTACGGSPCSADPFSPFSDTHVGGNMLIAYNYTINTTGRFGTGGGLTTGNSRYFAFNAYDNICQGQANHCEIFEDITAASSTLTNVLSQGETFIGTTTQGTWGSAGYSGTTVLYASTGEANGQTFTNVNYVDDTIITNKLLGIGGSAAFSTAINASYISIGTFTGHGNYIDSTGTIGNICFFQTVSTPPTITTSDFGSSGSPGVGGTQNVSLRTGQTVNSVWTSSTPVTC